MIISFDRMQINKQAEKINLLKASHNAESELQR